MRLPQAVRMLVFLLLASVFGTSAAQSDLQASETRVQAAFLFKFGSYVEWPAGTFATAVAPFTIGVVDADPLADELTKIVAGRDIEGRPIVVHRLHQGDPIGGMHMVFFGKTGRDDLAAMLATLDGQSTLAVTQSEGALSLGSMINFVVVDGKLRFDVALAPAAAGNLKISSRLLAVARKVRERS